jgi:hypothetical protein
MSPIMSLMGKFKAQSDDNFPPCNSQEVLAEVMNLEQNISHCTAANKNLDVQ